MYSWSDFEWRYQIYKLMIYEDCSHYTPSLKIHSDQFVLLDLTKLDCPQLQSHLKQRAGELNCCPSKLKTKLKDTILSIGDLNGKVSAVLLEEEDQARPFTLVCKPTQ